MTRDLYDEVVSIELAEIDNTYDIVNYEAVTKGGVYEDEGHFFIDGRMVHNCIPQYVERRDDVDRLWVNSEHPEIVKLLEETHGIICYQEQLQALWQKFADFTAPEAEKARKAIAKKWTDRLKGIEEKWKKGASKKLGEKMADEMWTKMQTFGRYAFNKCLSKHTILKDPTTNIQMTAEALYNKFQKGEFDFSLLSQTDSGEFVPDKVEEVICSGEQELYEVEFDNGITQIVTLKHKFKCYDGEYRTIQEIAASTKPIEVVVCP